MVRVIQSADQDLVFSKAVLQDHPVPWMRLRAARGRTPPGLEPYNQATAQETLADHPDCNGTLQCALNSCRVLFATAGMVATRRKLLLQGDPQTRFAFSFVDESSRHSIPVGLDLAAFGAQCMFCGDAGQLRPYSAITLLAAAAKGQVKGVKVTAQHIAWPASEHFANLNVPLDQGPQMQYGDSQRFATSSVLQFVLYRTRCTACVLTQQFRMDVPLATVVCGLFTGGSLGWYPAWAPPLPPPVLAGQRIRIVSTDDPEWKSELTRYGMSDALVRLLRREVSKAWESLVMDEAMRNQGNLSRDEALLVLHFLEHAHISNQYPPKSVAIVTTHYAQMLWLLHCVWEAGRHRHGNQAYECVQTITTLDRYQGLQAPVVLASLVSSEPGIMKDVVRANTLTSRAQSELHLFGAFLGWEESPLTAGWLSGLRVMAAELQNFPSPADVQKVRLPGVMYQQPTLAKKESGVIYRFKGGGLGVVGQWLWKPWRKHAKASDPWGFSPPQSDQLLDWERIMANKRVGTLEMRVRLEAGDVKPKHLGVTLPDFTEWALPYILLRDEDTGWVGWHDIEGLERVCHTDELADHEQRPVQFLLSNPLCEAQTYSQPPRSSGYRTVSLPVWQDAYKHVDTVGFLGDDFCTPLGVYVASLLHGVRECEGGQDVCAPHAVHHGHAQHCGWKPLPDRLKRYVLGMVAPAEKPTLSPGIPLSVRKS